jgi:pimeloyl-ACP methyl ester carboxylesterase
VLWLIGSVLLAYLAVASVVYYKQEALLYPAPRGVGDSMRGYRDVAYETADGLRLSGGYRQAAPGKPTLLFFHGNAATWQSTTQILAPLADAGYGVFAASYRGYRANPGSPSETGLYRDARAAAAWLAAIGVGEDDLVIVGNSLGSGPAVELARTIRPRGLVLISPFASMTEVAAANVRWLPVEWLMRDRYDNAAKLPEISAPVLILHGDRDTLIPLAHAQRLAGLARNGTLVTVRNAGHELVGLEQTPALMANWLDNLSTR